jgi:hypothetical protein
MPYGALFDSTDIASIPGNAEEIASYVDGAYRNWPAAHARFPHARHLSITVEGRLDAMCADCESGAMTEAQTAQWAARKLHLQVRPRVYTSLDNWGNVIDAMAWYKVPAGSVWWWIAAWTGHAHVIPGAACVQYASPGWGLPESRHYDVSEIHLAHFMPGIK